MNTSRVSGRIARAASGLAALIVSSALAACAGSSPAVPSTTSAAQSTGARADIYADWRKSVMKIALPRSGCFHASYPSYAWKSVACSTPPNNVYPLSEARRMQIAAETSAVAGGQNVGNGTDYTADTSPNVMSEAIGSFPAVSGVTSVDSVENPEFGDGGEYGTNSYTLQLNSYFFSTSACGTIKNCAGWEQFVYENPPGKSGGELFIQDWLVPTTTKGLSGCPKSAGWESVDGGCVQNSKAIGVPNQAITGLSGISETGEAASSGDSIYLSSGSDVYGMQKIQGDGITDLSAHWEGAEFNVIGNADGAIANFNSGSSITVSLEANDGVLTAPACPGGSGTTGESNNLGFSSPPVNPSKEEYPSILFTESSPASGVVACDALAGSGI